MFCCIKGRQTRPATISGGCSWFRGGTQTSGKQKFDTGTTNLPVGTYGISGISYASKYGDTIFYL